MKRKKQAKELSNGLGDEHRLKRGRSESRAPLNTDEEDGHAQSRELPSRRRSARQVEQDDLVGIEESAENETDDLSDGNAPTPVKPRKDLASSTKAEGQMNRAMPSKTTLKGKNLFSTPTKSNGLAETEQTPSLVRHADRSARRKSTRNLIERTVLGNTSDNEEEDDNIEHHIYDSDEENFEQIAGVEEKEPGSLPTTPAKRGRPKGSKNRQRSPTPTNSLPSHEVYFSQNRGGHSKTSNNNLASLALLDHEEYFALARSYVDPHADDLDSLQKLYAGSFNQWRFELSQDFNLCLYGWGSKRSLLLAFANYIYKIQPDHINRPIVVVNGYVRNLTVRDILTTIAGAISDIGIRMGSQPAEMLEKLIAALEQDKNKIITLFIHSVDGPALRRPVTQTILSRLSSHPQIQLIASADHPSFPLLWDSSLRSAFNFLFHDCTTVQPYSSEVDVVEEVHELLGRSGRRVGGKEGVSFVLKSLPENAKNLFRVLIGEQLATMDENQGAGFVVIDDDDNYDSERHASAIGRHEPGVEYKVLYQKACEEFICSSEMNFRTLLKEFHDHQMVHSRKDILGAEVLSVPFRKEELETILEDLMS
ncbi:hypothetical protein OIDMADRAFT_135189 [Oidiodendron maius Zn]|uniref:Origin recognition complex subunit 2 n=1 Tax=Oidiodendron maius (strain Zn) TaxID=913774 RepID=A0A0C3CZ30_OIDMZ|nr:hypothetical protein OIDMADRAFT_135189 [Oidiodendron maius Zn]